MSNFINTEVCEIVPKIYIKSLVNRIDEVMSKELCRREGLEEFVFDREVYKNNIELENKKESEEIEDPFSSDVAEWEKEQEGVEKKKRYGFGLEDDELPSFDNIASGDFEFTIDDYEDDINREEEIFFPDDSFI